MKNLTFSLLAFFLVVVAFLAFNNQSMTTSQNLVVGSFAVLAIYLCVKSSIHYVENLGLEEDILKLQNKNEEIEEDNELLNENLRSAYKSLSNLKDENFYSLSNVIYLADRYGIKLKIETNEIMEVSVYRYPQYSIKETAKVDNQKQAVEFIIHKVAEYFPENEFNTYFSKKGFDL